MKTIKLKTLFVVCTLFCGISQAMDNNKLDKLNDQKAKLQEESNNLDNQLKQVKELKKKLDQLEDDTKKLDEEKGNRHNPNNMTFFLAPCYAGLLTPYSPKNCGHLYTGLGWGSSLKYGYALNKNHGNTHPKHALLTTAGYWTGRVMRVLMQKNFADAPDHSPMKKTILPFIQKHSTAFKVLHGGVALSLYGWMAFGKHGKKVIKDKKNENN